ncbi:MAG: hypothetical protein IJX81_06200 [Clostridia bacterium]|nr:hypothetical protein [Clostridia bacterium]
MKDELQMEEELSLTDIFRALLSKIKLLILITLVGVIVGGTIGAVTTMNTHYYGTEMQFYVNPKEKEEGANESTYGVYGAYGRNVMDNMIKLLESDLFTEQLMLRGSTLPKKGLSTDLDIKIDDANAKLATALPLLEAANDAEEVYEDAVSTFNTVWANSAFKDNVFNEKLYEQGKYTPDINEAYAAVLVSLRDYTAKDEAATEAQNAYDKAKTAALQIWRRMESYKKEHDTFSEAISYSYLASDDDLSDASNLARSFIYVNVSLLNDKELAEEMLEILRVQVPAYVSQKMIVPTGYIGTSCEETTTRSEIVLTNEGYMFRSAVLYAVLVGVLALLVAAVIVIILDRSDKRLRDYDAVAKRMNIPVLGIIPSISEEVLNEWKHLNEEKGDE